MTQKFISISSKLIFLVLSISIISIVITSVLSFTLSESIIKNDVESSLKFESINRGNSISSIIEHRIENLQSFASYNSLKIVFSELNLSLDEVTFRKMLADRQQTLENEVSVFQKEQLDAGLRELTIVNSLGRILYSSNYENQIGSFAKGFSQVNKPTIEFIQDPNKIRLMKISIPIKSDGMSQYGTITATMTSSVFDDILLNRFGLEETGDVYLVNKNAIMISESIFIDNAEFNQRVDTFPVSECFESGKSIDGLEYLDYRDVEIFGVSYCRDDLGFVLLTEVDESVILEPIYGLQEKIILVGGSIVVGASIVTFFLSKKFSRPILRLKSATEKVTKGDFDVQTNIKTNDEIEELSKSFDFMVKTLKETVLAITERENIIRRQENLLLQFSKEKEDHCVCLVDLVGSIKITEGLTNEQKKSYYKIFTDNVMDEIKRSGGITVKFIDNAILFYFPNEDDKVHEKYLECCLKIAELNKKMNEITNSQNLPGIGYRISTTFGAIQIVTNDSDSLTDIFGEPVNTCFKINQYALPNTVVMDKQMYEKSKELNFNFTKLDKSIVEELKFDLYIVSRK